MPTVDAQVDQFRDQIRKLKDEIAKVIVGHEEVVEQVVSCLLAGQHALLEGVPGLGKTLLVRTLSDCLQLKFSRIQFTPDLMPADIIGTNIVMEDEQGHRSFRFQPGPIFGNIILADEINRATPKTQSALLEAMQELTVTVAGTSYQMEEPFLVLATQNPIEMEGTYPLPEAQLDRFFFKIEVRTGAIEQLIQVLDRTTGKPSEKPSPVLSASEALQLRELAREVPIASHVMSYAARLVLATHPEGQQASSIARRYVRYGSSPRGGQSLVLAGKIRALLHGRYNVSFEDIRAVAPASLRHRLILNFEGEAEGIRTDAIIAKLLEELPELPQAAEKLARKL